MTLACRQMPRWRWRLLTMTPTAGTLPAHSDDFVNCSLMQFPHPATKITHTPRTQWQFPHPATKTTHTCHIQNKTEQECDKHQIHLELSVDSLTQASVKKQTREQNSVHTVNNKTHTTDKNCSYYCCCYNYQLPGHECCKRTLHTVWYRQYCQNKQIWLNLHHGC